MQGHFEARKVAYRQAKDGVVVSFVIHPNDIDGAFAAAPLGTIFVIGYATPEEAEQTSGPPIETPEAPTSATGKGADKPVAANLTPGERAVRMAGILCADQQFQEWLWREVWDQHGGCVFGEPADAAEWEDWTAAEIRQRCNIISRKQLKDDDMARARWEKIETAFRQATGQMAVDHRSGA